MPRNKINIYYEPFHHITVQPNTDIFSYLAKDFRENKNLTCVWHVYKLCRTMYLYVNRAGNVHFPKFPRMPTC